MATNSPDDALEDRIGGTESAAPAKGWETVDKVVFAISFGIIVVVCLLGVVFTDAVSDATGAALSWVTGNFGWLFILGATGFVVFSLVLAFG